MVDYATTWSVCVSTSVCVGVRVRVCANQGGISSPKVVCSYMQLRFSLICFSNSYFGVGWGRRLVRGVADRLRRSHLKIWDAVVLRVWETPSSTLSLSVSLCHTGTNYAHTRTGSASLSLFSQNTSSLRHPHSLSLSHLVSPSLPLLPPFAHLFVHVMASGVVHLVPLVHVDDPSPRR